MIKFPAEYSDKQIETKHKQLEKHIRENDLIYMNAQLRKDIKPQNKKQSKLDILLTTSVDNPTQIYETLSVVDKKLADQYFDKTKVYLNVQA